MGWLQTLYLLVVLLAGAAGLWLAAYAWKRRSTPGALPLFFFLVGAQLRALPPGLRWVAEGWPWIGQLTVAGGAIVPTAWFVMALEYARGEKGLRSPSLALLLIKPITFPLAYWTNDRHGWMYSVQQDGVHTESLMWLFVAYSLALVLSGAVLIIRRLWNIHNLRRWQILALIIAILSPVTGTTLTLARIIPFDPAPLTFIVAGLALTLCIFRFRFLDVMPIARATVVEEMQDGVLVLDSIGRVVDANPSARALLDEQDPVGRPLPEPIALVLEGRGSPNLEARQSPLHDRRGRAIGDLVMLRDVSAQRRAEAQQRRYTEALEATQAELKDLDAAKSRFYANISHELRTPLTLILGPIADALSSDHDGLDPALRRRLELTHRNALKLRGLIDQLLDLSKLDAGRLRLRARRASLISLLKTLTAMFHSEAERRNITFQCLIPEADDESLGLYFDPEKLESILVNLLSNAFKHTPDQGRILLKTDVREDEVEILVRDTGPGIPGDEQESIFDRFHQTPATERSGQAGTGIGLALAKSFAELHGGTLTVESEPGFGASFFLRLPVGKDHLRPEDLLPESVVSENVVSQDLLPQDPGSETPALRDGPSEADGRHRSPEDSKELSSSGAPNPAPDAPVVLLVEDNDDLRSYLRAHLDSRYRVVEAVDGAEGLKKAQTLIPDLILSDVMMPKMDGESLCRTIKADERLAHIPVVLLTAKAGDEQKVEGLEAGADDYIVKPFDIREVLARAENLIEIRKLLRRGQDHWIDMGARKPVEAVSADDRLLERARNAVEQGLGDYGFGVERLAEQVHLSPRQLQRTLRRLTGLSAAGYIRAHRLQTAADLLQQRAGQVSEIAHRVGFRDPKHFSKLFRQVYGILPSEVDPSSPLAEAATPPDAPG